MADLLPLATQSQLRVRDPLSDVTRKERRALLATALLGVTIRWTGLLPTEIQALGVKLASSDQRALLNVFAIVITYFLLAFVLYASSDFLAWRLAIREAIREASKRRRSMDADAEDLERQIHEEVARSYPLLNVRFTVISLVSSARAAFEFVLPCVVGGVAIWILLAPQAP